MMTEISVMNSQNIFTTNGFDMHYEIHGSGAPLLVLHGFTGSSVGLASLFSPFLDTHQLIIPDLRGHGRSTNPSKQFTFTQAASDIFSLLEHLNIDTCSAVGFSGGACTLLHMATQKPNSVRSMALVSATTHFPEKTRELMRQFTVESRTTDDWESMRQKHHHGDDQIKMLWEQANAFSESQNDMNFTPKLLSQIKAKTLILQGDRDPLYPVEISVEMYRDIPNSALWIIPNGGHVPITDDFIPSFMRYLKSFL